MRVSLLLVQNSNNGPVFHYTDVCVTNTLWVTFRLCLFFAILSNRMYVLGH